MLLIGYFGKIHSNVACDAFKTNGETVKTMTVDDGYTLQSSDYPTVPENRLNRLSSFRQSIG